MYILNIQNINTVSTKHLFAITRDKNMFSTPTCDAFILLKENFEDTYES